MVPAKIQHKTVQLIFLHLNNTPLSRRRDAANVIVEAIVVGDANY